MFKARQVAMKRVAQRALVGLEEALQELFQLLLQRLAPSTTSMSEASAEIKMEPLAVLVVITAAVLVAELRRGQVQAVVV